MTLVYGTCSATAPTGLPKGYMHLVFLVFLFILRCFPDIYRVDLQLIRKGNGNWKSFDLEFRTNFPKVSSKSIFVILCLLHFFPDPSQVVLSYSPTRGQWELEDLSSPFPKISSTSAILILVINTFFPTPLELVFSTLNGNTHVEASSTLFVFFLCISLETKSSVSIARLFGFSCSKSLSSHRVILVNPI